MSKHSFHFSANDSPTQYNLAKILCGLGYTQTSTPGNAAFNDENLRLNSAYTEQLEHKHLLARLISAYCPEIMPPTYPINDDNFAKVLEGLVKDNQTGWILKPALLNNGTGIKLFVTLEQVYEHYASSHRYGGEHVLQRYVCRPHLLNGHKYTFRMFSLITNQQQAFFYPKGYFNVCRQAYLANDFSQLSSHLTNEHLNQGNVPNNWQIPTDHCPNFENILKKMKSSITEVITSLNKNFYMNCKKNNKKIAFSFFGFDFLLDENLKLWLLEVNHGPCFPKESLHPLQQPLYQDFWAAVIEEFVLPIMENSPSSCKFTPNKFQLITTSTLSR